MSGNERHWTADDARRFKLAVVFDFIGQIQRHLDEQGLSRAQLAKRLGVSESRVSQIFSDPGNLTVGSMVELGRALELKLSILAYDDGDAENRRGPLHADVFHACWEALNRPATMWDIEDEKEKAARHSCGRASSCPTAYHAASRPANSNRAVAAWGDAMPGDSVEDQPLAA